MGLPHANAGHSSYQRGFWGQPAWVESQLDHLLAV